MRTLAFSAVVRLVENDLARSDAVTGGVAGRKADTERAATIIVERAQRVSLMVLRNSQCLSGV